jgi:hypothetical protein
MNKIFRRTLQILIIIICIPHTNAATSFVINNSSSNGVLGSGMSYHCFNNGPTGHIETTITLKSPNGGGASTSTDVAVWVKYKGYKTGHRFNFSVPNDGNFHTQAVNYVEFLKTIYEGGEFSYISEWASSQIETATPVFLFIKSVQLDIEGSRRPGKIILAACSPTNSIRIKGKGWVCPGTSVQNTIEVQEVDRYTGSNVGTLFTSAITGTNLTDMENGNLSIATLISGTITLTNQSRYRVQLICNNNSGLWMSATNFFVWKTVSNFEFMSKDYTVYHPGAFNPNLEGDDFGEEENTNRYYNIYKSEDIVNKLSNSTSWIYSNLAYEDNLGSKHENPDYSATGNLNYMFVKVNNIGCGATPPSSDAPFFVRMYWTRARLGEIWDNDWKYNMTTNKIYSTNFTKYVPGGSEITISSPTFAAPYSNSSSPILTFPLSYPASMKAVMANINQGWYAPDPAWYDPANGSMSNSKPVICLLSKINDYSTPISSITADPLVWLQSNCDIDPFVRQNNNVATRNTLLMDNPGFLPPGAGNSETHFGTVIANNTSSNPTRICIRNIINPYLTNDNILNYGEMQIGFTNLIWTNWIANGAQGSGFTILSPTLVKATDPDSICFDSINIGNNLDEQIGIRMVWDSTAVYPTDTPLFEYAISQENSGGFARYFGSDVIIQFPVTAYVETTSGLRNGNSNSQNDKKSEKRSTTIPTMQANTEITYQIFPNPTSDNVTISMYGLNKNNNLSIEIMDIAGRLVLTCNDFNTDGNGFYYTTFNTNQFAKGVYTVKINAQDSSLTDKLIIQ